MKKQYVLGLMLLCAPLLASAATVQIPKMFHGHWEPTQAVCNTVRQNESGLSDIGAIINGKEITYYESSCELKSIGQITAQSMQGTFLCGDTEGQWENTFSLVLQNNQLFTGPDAEPRVKCKK